MKPSHKTDRNERKAEMAGWFGVYIVGAVMGCQSLMREHQQHVSCELEGETRWQARWKCKMKHPHISQKSRRKKME